MRKILIALSVAALGLTACQKEVSYENPDNLPGSGGGNNVPGLLYRLVLTDAAATDSSITNIVYDAAKRISLISTEVSGDAETLSFVRNSAGIVTQFVIKNAYTTANPNGLVVNVHYSTAESKYTYCTYDLDIPATPGNPAFSYRDSTVLSYDASGNLTSKLSYAVVAGVGAAPIARTDYTFTNNNVTSEKFYDLSAGGPGDLAYTMTYGYDDKVNALKLGVEALLLDSYISAFASNSPMYFGSNNATLATFDNGDPADKSTLTSTYTYNTANMPAAGTAVLMPDAENYKWRFYYQ